MASETPIAGTFRAQGSARGQQATLLLTADGTATVTGADGSAIASAALASIDVSDRVGSIPRRLSFGQTGTFETRDNDAVDMLLARGGRRAPVVHRLELFRPRLLVFVAAAIVLCFGLYRFAVPTLVEVAVAVTPPVVPQLMSRSVMVSLDATTFEPTGLPADRRAAITDGFARLAALTPRGRAATDASSAYTLNFREGGMIGPNAFALPDGTIVLTDELVSLAGGDDEMVLAVLAHEIGHVDQDHSLRQLYRAAGMAALIMMIGGDIGAATEDVLVQGAAVLSLSHSRGAEREADRYSVRLMHEAGHDPAALARFFELLRVRLGDSNEHDFLSTHPATPERIAEARRLATEIAAGGD